MFRNISLFLEDLGGPEEGHSVCFVAFMKAVWVVAAAFTPAAVLAAQVLVSPVLVPVVPVERRRTC